MAEMFTFTRGQLDQMLRDAIEMFFEYRDAYGHYEADAVSYAVNETMQGLDAERELAERGECKPTLQVIA